MWGRLFRGEKSAYSEGRLIGMSNDCYLRPYAPTDLPAVRRLFKTTVEHINWRDYSAEQLAAWIGDDSPLTQQRWQESLCQHQTLVAIKDDQVVGFADMSDTGYLDRLYVHAAYQRQGIATALVTALEEQMLAPRYTTYASITAKPFFMQMGYHVVRKNTVVRAGINLINFEMVKTNSEEKRE